MDQARSIVELQSSGNNNSYPTNQDDLMSSTMSTVSEREHTRRTAGLSGFSMDGHVGPIKSPRQVALYETTGSDYPESWVEDEDSLSTEVIHTSCDRDSNYVHAGWSLSTISALSPWMAFRISNRNHANSTGSWTTKRMLNKKRTINIPSEELRPSPEFEADIRDALSKHSRAERFQGVYKALSRWGDVVPLVFELGASLTITDVEQNAEQGGHWLVQKLLFSRSGRADTIGGKAKVISDGDFSAWMSQDLQPPDWRIVRVVEAMSTIHLLGRELQEQLANLHATILSYDPPTLDGVANPHATWVDTSRALNTVSKVIVRCSDSYVAGLSVVYMDGSRSNQHGIGNNEHVFDLSNGEYISDVIVWNDPGSASQFTTTAGRTVWTDAGIVCGIQFVTTAGRFSPHYGGLGGAPTILSSIGGVLCGFSGRTTIKNGQDAVGRVQTIWRHDIPQVASILGGRYAEYIGSTGGWPFNDWPFSGPSHSAHISSVDIRCGNEIHGIQITHTERRDDKTVVSRAPHHGGSGGNKHLFELAPGEHIIAVSGAQSHVVVRLCFITNTGRTSNAFGGNSGDAFMCQPRTIDGRGMRLAFLAGKYGNSLDGLLLVWAPL